MELSEMQARVAELEQQIFALPTGSITKKTVNGKEYFYIVGQRTKNDGRSISLWMNWWIFALKSSGGRNWSRN